MWRPVIEQLSEFDCLAVDLPEHGESRCVAPFSMELSARAVAELIRSQTRDGKAVVVGLSEGAQVTVQLLADSPGRAEKAIVSSALVRPLPGMGWMSSPPLLAWMYRLLVAPFRKSDWWIRWNMKYAAGVPEEFFEDFKKSFRELREASFVNLMRANQSFRLPSGLEKAAMPVLVLAGKHEYAAMRASARDLVTALPNARGGLIDLGKNSSLTMEHNWALYAPVVFARTVRAWIDGTALPEEIGSLGK
jgi:pimeloyl-ACP methyl ester carboxylesterase